MNKNLIKPGFRTRTKIYGICASIAALAMAVACGSLIVGAIGVLSLGIHIVSKH